MGTSLTAPRVTFVMFRALVCSMERDRQLEEENAEDYAQHLCKLPAASSTNAESIIQVTLWTSCASGVECAWCSSLWVTLRLSGSRRGRRGRVREWGKRVWPMRLERMRFCGALLLELIGARSCCAAAARVAPSPRTRARRARMQRGGKRALASAAVLVLGPPSRYQKFLRGTALFLEPFEKISQPSRTAAGSTVRQRRSINPPPTRASGSDRRSLHAPRDGRLGRVAPREPRSRNGCPLDCCTCQWYGIVPLEVREEPRALVLPVQRQPPRATPVHV
jgi:hypothetical protein